MKKIAIILLLFSGCVAPRYKVLEQSFRMDDRETRCRVECTYVWTGCLEEYPWVSYGDEPSPAKDACARVLNLCMEGC